MAIRLIVYYSFIEACFKWLFILLNVHVISANQSAEEHSEESRPLFRVDSSTTLMPGTPTTPVTPEQPSESATSADVEIRKSIMEIVKAVIEVMRKR